MLWQNTGITYQNTPERSFADRGLSYAVAKYWNNLPEHTRGAKEIKTFKSLLKQHFLHQYFLHNNILQHHFHNVHKKN